MAAITRPRDEHVTSIHAEAKVGFREAALHLSRRALPARLLTHLSDAASSVGTR